MPTLKVITNLVQLSALEIRNLRGALQASREGRVVVVMGDRVSSRKDILQADIRHDFTKMC